MHPTCLLVPALILAFQAGGGAVPEATDQEKALVSEMSRARTNPKEYAQHLETLRVYYDGTLWRLPDRTPIRTEEGLEALDEAIAFLRKTPAVGPLRWNNGLSRAARDHVLDQGPSGQTGHKGTDGSSVRDRILRRGLHLSTFGEVVNYGEETARMHVIQLLIDDGVSNRGHRKNIFNPDFHVAGGAIGPHKEFGSMAVVVLADDFKENPD